MAEKDIPINDQSVDDASSSIGEAIQSAGSEISKKIKKNLVSGGDKLVDNFLKSLSSTVVEMKTELEKGGDGIFSTDKAQEVGKAFAESAEGLASGIVSSEDFKKIAENLLSIIGPDSQLAKDIQTTLNNLEIKDVRDKLKSGIDEGVEGALQNLPSNWFTKAIGMDAAINDGAKEFFQKFSKAGMAVGQFISKNWKLALGAALIAGAFLAIDDQVNAIGDNFGAVSNQMQADLITLRADFARLGMSAEDLAATVQGLSGDFGLSVERAKELAPGIADTSKALGVSAQEGTKLVGILMKTSGLSAEQAQNFLKGAEMMARTAGIAPGVLMKDIANASEEFALFSKDGGENMAKAAVTARKFGMELSTLAKTAKGLLNFQDSLNAELEASIMIGRNINLQKARQLALEGDIAGVAMEISRIVGGQAEFEKMSVLEREALANAVGLSVEELSKFVSLQGKSNAELKRTTDFDVSEVVGEDAIGNVTQLKNELEVAKLQILGFVASIANLGGIFGDVNPLVQVLILGTLALTAYFGFLIIKTLAQAAANRFLAKSFEKLGKAKAKADVPPKGGGIGKSLMKMGKNLLPLAGSMILIAGAVFILAKAFQGFSDVTWDGVSKGITVMVAFTAMVLVIGAFAAIGIKLSLAILILAVAVGVLALAMMGFAKGSEMFIPFLDWVVENGLAAFFPLMALGLAFSLLSTLLLFASAGILIALPGLIILTGFLALMTIILPGIASGMETFSTALTPLLDRVGEVGQLAIALAGLAGSMFMLSGALLAVGLAGVFALPTLMALGIGGGMFLATTGGDGGAEGEGTNTKDLYDQLVLMNGRLATLEENFHKNWVPAIVESNVDGAKKGAKEQGRIMTQNLGFAD
tara:strand:- start:8274 stop:10889 length:2616 start_codon:yes stop_codon:yes gene_type:complete